MHEEIYPFLSDGREQPINFMLAGISYCDGSYRISRPGSDVACVEYVISGRGTVLLDGKPHYPAAGDTYFLPIGHDQLYYSSEDDPWVKVWVNFSGPLAVALTECYGVAERCCFPSLYTGDLLRSIVHAAAERKEDCILNATLQLHEIFYRMGRARENRPLNRTAALLRDYIDLHYTEPINAATIAAAVGKSPSQCSRVFVGAYGETPYQYLLSRRIALARILLESSGLSVRDIAARLSFCDEYYFSNLFKQRVGVSPSAYRAGGRLK